MKPTVNHPHELISARMDGELTTAESQHVKFHLAACDECRALAADLERIEAALGSEAVPPVPGSLSGKIVWRVRGTGSDGAASSRRARGLDAASLGSRNSRDSRSLGSGEPGSRDRGWRRFLAPPWMLTAGASLAAAGLIAVVLLKGGLPVGSGGSKGERSDADFAGTSTNDQKAPSGGSGVSDSRDQRQLGGMSSVQPGRTGAGNLEAAGTPPRGPRDAGDDFAPVPPQASAEGGPRRQEGISPVPLNEVSPTNMATAERFVPPGNAAPAQSARPSLAIDALGRAAPGRSTTSSESPGTPKGPPVPSPAFKLDGREGTTGQIGDDEYRARGAEPEKPASNQKRESENKKQASEPQPKSNQESELLAKDKSTLGSGQGGAGSDAEEFHAHRPPLPSANRPEESGRVAGAAVTEQAGAGMFPQLDRLADKDKPVSLVFHEERASDVFEVIERISTLDIELGGSFPRELRITVRIEKTPLKEALARIGASYGLRYEVLSPQRLIVTGSGASGTNAAPPH